VGSRISVGIVGPGSFGGQFVAHFKNHPLVGRVALCDANSRLLSARAREFQIAETYGSLEELLASDIEAVAIFTQHWLHASHAVMSLKAGKHVYSAVPACRTLEECDALVSMVRKTGLVYMLGETTVFRPDAAFCRRKAQEGAFGEIVYCEGEYIHDISHGLVRVMQERYGQDWRYYTGEPPMWYPTHSVSGPVYITGSRMTEVSARGWLDTDPDGYFRQDTETGNLFSNEIALFRMSGGAVCRIAEMRRVGHPTHEGFRIFGTKGSYLWDASGRRWCAKDGWTEVVPDQWYEPLPEELKVPSGHGGSHVYMVHEFVMSVAGMRVPRTDVVQAVGYCAPGIVAHQSAQRDGELLKIPDWE